MYLLIHKCGHMLSAIKYKDFESSKTAMEHDIRSIVNNLSKDVWDEMLESGEAGFIEDMAWIHQNPKFDIEASEFWHIIDLDTVGYGDSELMYDE